LSSEKDRATATANAYKKLVTFGRVVFEIYERTQTQTNKQTDRQTDTLITILRMPVDGEVKSTHIQIG